MWSCCTTTRRSACCRAHGAAVVSRVLLRRCTALTFLCCCLRAAHCASSSGLARSNHRMHSGPPAPSFPRLSPRHLVSYMASIRPPLSSSVLDSPAYRTSPVAYSRPSLGTARGPSSFPARPRHPRRTQNPRPRGARLRVPWPRYILARTRARCMHVLYVGTYVCIYPSRRVQSIRLRPCVSSPCASVVQPAD
ncbi:hypothetical protein FB451DRAFT_1213613 [Mycena latifolia]|nr:hypothetical protein FB451DRAFT_1213613 [Mycena latifolia]